LKKQLFKNDKTQIMKLFTKEIEEKAQAQYPLGSDLEKQMVVAKFFNPTGAGTWYLINQDPKIQIIAGVFVISSNGKLEAFQNLSWRITKVEWDWV
jgi:hypothetical protein